MDCSRNHAAGPAAGISLAAVEEVLDMPRADTPPAGTPRADTPRAAAGADIILVVAAAGRLQAAARAVAETMLVVVVVVVEEQVDIPLVEVDIPLVDTLPAAAAVQYMCKETSWSNRTCHCPSLGCSDIHSVVDDADDAGDAGYILPPVVVVAFVHAHRCRHRSCRKNPYHWSRHRAAAGARAGDLMRRGYCYCLTCSPHSLLSPLADTSAPLGDYK